MVKIRKMSQSLLRAQDERIRKMTLADTIDLMNSPDYKERFKAEYYQPKSRSKPSRYSSENDVLIEKSVKYTDFFLLSIVYV